MSDSDSDSGSDTGSGSGSDRAPAPGRLRVIQELLNTVDLEGGEDLFTTPERTAAWLREKGLLAHGSRPFTRRHRDDVVQLREALRALAEVNHGAAVDSRAVDALNQLSRSAPLVVQVDPEGSPVLAPADSGAASAIAAVLSIVQASAADGTWNRLKVCRSSTCRWAFYDRSKNRSGSWCSMAVCGNRAKARTFRERQGSASRVRKNLGVRIAEPGAPLARTQDPPLHQRMAASEDAASGVLWPARRAPWVFPHPASDASGGE